MNSKIISSKDFKATLSSYKSRIDAELSIIADNLLVDTGEMFGDMPKEVVAAYVSVLTNGGKRIRGSLAIAAYEMFGGTDDKMITKAAAALEMLNTYILVADDIQDRSETRRGGRTAHMQLSDFHKKHHLKGDSLHFGEALAINSFLIAQHYASNIILGLDVPATVKVAALENVNKCFVVTAHGQTMDIFVEAQESASDQDAQNILLWKTAYYTFINPLQMGAILAQSSSNQIEALTEYGKLAGKVFQITDDIIGTFGEEAKTGKSQIDDIKEGKRTILVLEALRNAPEADAYFLNACLGNQKITQADFERCQKIIQDTGALKSAQNLAKISADKAIQTLSSLPPSDSKLFFESLTKYLLVRES